MIGWLRGNIVSKQPPELVVDVGGVGYELQCPMSTFYELPASGARISVFTHLVVRDDAHTLYGFATETERALFRNLIKVSGVGPRLGLAILSGISVAGFEQSVLNEDTAALTKVPGIGKKTAERLILDMRDRIDATPDGAPATGKAAAPRGTEGEAYNALVALGYKPKEATGLLNAVDKDGKTTEQIIREALKSSV